MGYFSVYFAPDGNHVFSWDNLGTHLPVNEAWSDHSFLVCIISILLHYAQMSNSRLVFVPLQGGWRQRKENKVGVWPILPEVYCAWLPLHTENLESLLRGIPWTCYMRSSRMPVMNVLWAESECAKGWYEGLSLAGRLTTKSITHWPELWLAQDWEGRWNKVWGGSEGDKNKVDQSLRQNTQRCRQSWGEVEESKSKSNSRSKVILILRI